MSYAVLFQEFPLDNLESVVPAVSAACQIPAFDVATKIRRGWGFLARHVTEERARQMAQALANHGIGTTVLAEAALRPLPDSQIMVGFDADDQILRPKLQDPVQAAQLIPWTNIAIVAAGGFSEEMIRRGGKADGTGKGAGSHLVSLGVFLVTGIPAGLFGGKKQVESKKKVTQFIIFAQIITTTGDSFFISPDHFDFSGLGPLKQLNASLNFRSLIADWTQRSSARTNYGARFVLDRKSLTLANHQSVSDLETELLWMLNTD